MDGHDPDASGLGHADWPPPAVELGKYLTDHGYTVEQRRGTEFHTLWAVRGNVRFEVDWWLGMHVLREGIGGKGWRKDEPRWARMVARRRGHDWWPGTARLVAIRDPSDDPVDVTEEDFAEWKVEAMGHLARSYLRTLGDVRRLAGGDEAAIVRWVKRVWDKDRFRGPRKRRVFPWALRG